MVFRIHPGRCAVFITWEQKVLVRLLIGLMLPCVTVGDDDPAGR